jgi:serine/threonine-protein kinase
MELYCTRPSCPKPKNQFSDLDDPAVLKNTEQKYCTACGMPLLLQGRYLTVRLLGEGGFGAAFLARDRLTPKLRPCVVKQFKPANQLTRQQQELAHNLFEKEAEILDQLGLESPHIPDLFAFFDLTIPNQHTGQSDHLFYIVQEFIDGHTLEEMWTQGQRFSEADLVELLNQLLPVLSFIHSHNVIHRDIKPSNIMRHRNGRFYLLDFGAIRDATKAGAKTSTSIYSLGYAPPEQMAGQEVFFSSDLYALAATCVVLLTGKEPREIFNSATNQWQWSQHAQVSPKVVRILDQMLAPNPHDRFWSASDVLQTLQTATGVQSSGSHIHRMPGHTTIQPSTAPNPAPATVAPRPAPLPINPTPAQPIAVSAPANPALANPAVATPARRPFSLLEYLSGAVFTGFEGALLAIGLARLPLPLWAQAMIWGGMALVIIVLQSQRIIEKIDLVILAAITLLVVVWLVRPDLELLAIAIISGICTGIAIASLFRLVYQLLSKIL